MRRAASVVTSLAALFAASGAWAAETPPTKAAPAQAAPAPAAPTPPPQPIERPPPYEPQLLKLAEMMGALAFLRDLCGAGDGADFRAKMAALLDADAVTESQRDLLAGAYNKGFQDYETACRVCSPNSHVVISRYLSETAKLAAEVAGRYGG